ncbi:hypothetical protein Nepgr_016591 [Nepenthes gracilis]|uniref:Uncharacterized protein n=1 Tax=Nepenthes gracilis TaxID=150966 RepID=A0AAD3SMY3_NEPGR|nr:hypothetical protein Nepgr_016591 [Nepenthes gracilis]
MGGCASSLSQTAKKAEGKASQARRTLQPFSSSRRRNSGDNNSQKDKPSVLHTVKVVDMDGRVQEYKPQISAEQVMSQNPNRFLCSWETMLIDSCAQPVPDQEGLQPGHLYFLMPATRTNWPLSLEDLCDLAIKASSNLCINDLPSALDWT